VLFSAAYSPDSRLRELWRRKNITLLTSSYAAEEARRNLKAPHKTELEKLLKKISVVPTVQMPPINPLPPEAIALHDKDIPILLDAIASRATHLLTGDFTHFGPYYGKTLKGVRILPPAKYLGYRAK
jgi:predicted nucleic acid-binding protein